MGIYNAHTLQYILLISDGVALSEAIKYLKDNNINLKIRRNEKTNERYIILTVLNNNDVRFTNSKYYKDNYHKWSNDYDSYTTQIKENINIELNKEEKTVLNTILLSIPEIIDYHGWYDENSVSTTYGDYYFTAIEYNIAIKNNVNIERIKQIIKKVCNEHNYQVCDFVKCNYTNELHIKIVNDVQLRDRKMKSAWFNTLIANNKVYRRRIVIDDLVDMVLTEKENYVLEDLKELLKDYVLYDGWYLENNIYSESLYYY